MNESALFHTSELRCSQCHNVWWISRVSAFSLRENSSLLRLLSFFLSAITLQRNSQDTELPWLSLLALRHLHSAHVKRNEEGVFNNSVVAQRVCASHLSALARGLHIKVHCYDLVTYLAQEHGSLSSSQSQPYFADSKHKFCWCCCWIFSIKLECLIEQPRPNGGSRNKTSAVPTRCLLPRWRVSDWAHLLVSMCSRSLLVLNMTCVLARSHGRAQYKPE